MPSFPALRSGQVMRLGSTAEKAFATRTIEFEDDSEQRWATAKPLVRRQLVLANIDPYDLANILEFWRSMKGRYDTTWDITIGGVTESNCAFDGDDFTVTERKPGRFDLTLRLVQIVS